MRHGRDKGTACKVLRGCCWVWVGVSPAKEAVGYLRHSSEREWDGQV